MKRIRVLVVAAALVLQAGCAGQQTAKPGEFGLNKSTGGGLLGAIGGGLAGSQFGRGSGNLAATAVGTLLGGYVGYKVGESLDRADQAYASRAEQTAHAAPVGQQIRWANPESGHSGTYTPVREGRDAAGNTCREYQTTVTVGGETQQAFGTACRQADGSWRVVQ
jgi:surface antigen